MGIVISFGIWKGLTSVYQIGNCFKLLFFWIEDFYYLDSPWLSVDVCWFREAAVPCREVVNSVTLVLRSMLSTNAVEKKSLFKFIGIITPSLSFASITLFPTDVDRLESQCLLMDSPNFDLFQLTPNFLFYCESLWQDKHIKLVSKNWVIGWYWIFPSTN